MLKMGSLGKYLSPLVAPFSYWRIRLKGRVVHDLWLPLGLAVLTLVASHTYLSNSALFGDKGFVSEFKGLFEVLVGFYVAALAAVVSFGAESLDQTLRGNPAVVREWSNSANSMIDRELTRRQFCASLFGYLSASALAMILIISLGDIWEHHAVASIPSWLNLVFELAVLTYFWNIIVTTLVGIYFLSDRIPRDRK